MNDKPASRLDPRYTLLAVILLAIILFFLLSGRKAQTPHNPMETETAKKARQSIKNDRTW